MFNPSLVILGLTVKFKCEWVIILQKKQICLRVRPQIKRINCKPVALRFCICFEILNSEREKRSTTNFTKEVYFMKVQRTLK